MLETLIKQALAAAGLDEGLFARIKVTSEAQITDAVKKLKREIDTEKLTAAMDAAGLKDTFESVVKSLVDQRVTQAIKTHDEKVRADAEAAKAKADADKKTEGMTDEEKRLSSLLDAIKALTDKVTAIESKTNEVTRESTVKAALKAQGLPDTFAKYVTADTEDKIKEQIEGLKADIVTAKQAENDALLAEGRTPQGEAAESALEAAVAEYARGVNAPGAVGGGLAAQQIAKKG